MTRNTDVDVIDRPVAEQNAIVAAVETNPGLVLLDSQKFDQFYEKVKAECDKLDATVATKRGRDDIRAMAAKVTKTKTTIEAARLGLTAEWRDNIAKVNEAGKPIKERLEALADQVRKPLTEWEDAEKARVAECEATISFFRTSAVVQLGDTAATVRARGMEVFERTVDADKFGDMADDAESAREAAIASLKTGLARLEQEERDVAELARLREAEAARVEAAAEVERQRLIAAREAEAQRIAEEQRVIAAEAEAERIRRAEAAASERAREAAAAEAREAEEARQREHEEALAVERRRADEAEAAAQAERERVAAVAAEAERVRAVEQAAQEKREANQRHRTKLKTAAKLAIMKCGVDDETAVKIVTAIVSGDVPAVSLAF